MLVKQIYILAVVGLMMSACGASEQELFDEGVRQLEAGEYSKAVGYFDKVVEKNEENTSAFNAKGVALFQQKKFDEAIKAFTSSIRLDSTSYKPFFNRGNAYLEKKAYKEAIRDYNVASGLDAQQVDVYYNRGLALLAQEEYEDAIMDFDMALQATPDQALVHFNKAKAQLGNNDPLGGMESLINAINLDNNNGSAYYLLGVTQMSALNQKEEGCANLKMALNLGYADAQTWIDDFCKE
ncbi:tetratricopeptide repeat protein [Belliella sp. DSM 111904]|uniref:Tetratricopeptide repeat protein n=1 Tax=Belliella filtrata TaxID=2923435 RepID=A0ABS9UYQ2_9BACT|nr:tetratricopeptide repeat protein [Belliella filtrata]MCH7408865.1 tetratricopeptide repeat protein [Belliella filtrata]